ncbi:hypothetical protein V6C27_04890 [Peptococcaceae bacterium 1198_IL3148]
MIFASDLDRTLIYSSRFIADGGRHYRVEVGDYASYMTERAAALLQIIADRLIFVPCTTRTVEQYRRVTFVTDLQPKYAVTSNGGNLLIDGQLDQSYHQEILLKLRDCAPSADIIKEFNRIVSDAWVIKMKEAEGLFYYCLVDRPALPEPELAQFTSWAATQNWEISLQGHKLYLVPKVINKWAPIAKIMAITGETEVYTAGDSLLDLPLLTATPHHLCPRHGEVFQCYQQQFKGEKINFTRSEGLKAGEEVLETVLRWSADQSTLCFES